MTASRTAAGKKPCLATVRLMEEVHSFFGSLVRALGEHGAQQWLGEEEERGGATRLEALTTRDGLASVIREASPLLFVQAPRGERPRPKSLEDEEIVERGG